MSNACTDEILKLMKELLPSKNSLPKSDYKARKYLGHMGLSYISIHTCKFNCCLYRKDTKDTNNCLICRVAKVHIKDNPQGREDVEAHFPNTTSKKNVMM